MIENSTEKNKLNLIATAVDKEDIDTAEDALKGDTAEQLSLEPDLVLIW